MVKFDCLKKTRPILAMYVCNDVPGMERERNGWMDGQADGVSRPLLEVRRST